MPVFIIALLIIVFTGFDRHPDERAHFEAFEYFKIHWWPADIGTEGIYHSDRGWSRVYNGEIAYLLYGKMACPLHLFKIESSRLYLLLYRSINLILWVSLLWLLLHFRNDLIDTRPFFFMMLCIPQVTYLFSYANTDAFALAVAIFLFLLVLKLIEIDTEIWSWKQVFLMGMLLGFMLISKVPFILSLGLPALYMMMKFRMEWKRQKRKILPVLIKKFAVMALLAIAIAAPFQFIFPKSQGDYKEKKLQCNEKFAQPGFKPSNPSYPTYLLAEKGVTLYQMLTQYPWFKWTFYSYYGFFGYMRYRLPDLLYGTALLGFLLLFSLTLIFAVKHWKEISPLIKASLYLSPLLILLNMILSVRYSLTVDFQPQGRYLYPTLLNVFFLLTGLYRYQSPLTKKIVRFIFCVFYPLCIYILFRYAFLKCS